MYQRPVVRGTDDRELVQVHSTDAGSANINEKRGDLCRIAIVVQPTVLADNPT